MTAPLRALAETQWPHTPRARIRGEVIVDYEPGMSASEEPSDVALGRLDPEGCPACRAELVVSGHRVVCSSVACGYRTTTAVRRIG